MSQKKYIKEQKLRDLSLTELANRVRELKAQEYQLRFDKAIGKLENFRLVLQNRRRLATVLTILREGERASGGGK
jgi:large subunit ribosomal protein L29